MTTQLLATALSAGLALLLASCDVLAPGARRVRPEWEADGFYRVPPIVVGSLVIALDAGGLVTARQRLTGRVVWSRQVVGEGFTRALLHQDGVLLIPGVLLYALEPGTGNIRWVHPGVGEAAGAIEPAIAGDTVFVAGYSGLEATALDLHTGRPYWTTSLGKLVYTPTITERLAVYPIRSLTEVSELVALDRTTGAIQWRVALPDSAGRAGGTQYAGVQVGDRLVFGTHVAEAMAVRLADGAVLWKRSTGTSQRGGGYRRRPASAGGGVVLWRGDGLLENFDPATGETLWATQVGALTLGSPNRCGEHLCLQSGKSWVVSNHGQVLWEGGGPDDGNIFFLSDVATSDDGWWYASVTYNDKRTLLIGFRPSVAVGATQ
ncbi:MAG: PQQ-binding-like beta-propeller repeat protein [Gemmatimonadaceae bacterium]|nr:PQQ-binding-like beta-propeller repeat protein [Gemmatimonadaceae bacterium]